MSKFTNLYKSTTIKNKGTSVNIFKVKKEGTKRTFFSIENAEGKRVCRTMFARLYDAERNAKLYIDFVSKQNQPA